MAGQRDESKEPALSGFERDFGYLDKFLTALRERSAAFEGARRDRFLALLEGLPQRFAEIRALLGPAASADPTTPPPSRGESPPANRNSTATGSRDLTVGSLIRSNRATDS